MKLTSRVWFVSAARLREALSQSRRRRSGVARLLSCQTMF